MDSLEKEVCKGIAETFKLLKVNWNALASNPPCQRKINAYISEIDNYLLILDSHQRRLNFYRQNYKNRRKGLCK